MAQEFRGVIMSEKTYEEMTPIYELTYNPIHFLHSGRITEHAFVGNCYVEAFEKALAEEHYGKIFVWVGDYADAKFYQDIYRHSKKSMKPIRHTIAHESADRSRWKYVVNFDKKECVRIPEKTDTPQYHPLPLLCASGNGRGYSDYKGTNMDYVGKWAYDRIGIDFEIPEGFTEIEVTFTEE